MPRDPQVKHVKRDDVVELTKAAATILGGHAAHGVQIDDQKVAVAASTVIKLYEMIYEKL